MKSLPQADKSLGQHFLTDKTVINSIVSAYADECDVIVEVGPGPAVLTRHLAQLNKELFIIETDKRFTEILSEVVPTKNIFMQDALKFDWEQFIVNHNLSDKKIWLVSNLPYNISVPLTLTFTKINQIAFMTLMYQKEVGEKIINKIDKKNSMGSLKSICQNFFETSLLKIVKPGAFSPPPKVDSIVINFKRIPDPVVEINAFNLFETFLRALFMFKRKQIHHGLKNLIDKSDIDEKILKNICEKTIRAEALNLEQVYSLFKNYRNYQK